jgi:hypothetical protein
VNHPIRIVGSWLLTAIFLSGCGAVRQPVLQANVQEGSLSVKAAEREDKKLAEAHAHFSAAVIHEMNEEREAAMKEYYKAATADIGDEVLVLDVSRRLLQAKRFEDARLVRQAASRPTASGQICAARLSGQFRKPEKRSGQPNASGSLKRAGGYLLFVTYVQAKASGGVDGAR